MFSKYVGCILPIHKGDIVSDEHYIILDNTVLDYDDYSVVAKDGNLYISGSYASYETAVSEFYKILEREGDTVSIDEGILVSGKIDTPPIPYKNKQELFKVFEYFQNDDSILFGQHLAGSLKLDWYITDYINAVGEGPSVMEIDMVSFRNAEKGELSHLLCQTVEYAAKGGIITTMHHWLNPANPEDSFRGTLDSLDDWNKVITKGTALNTEWHKDLDIAGEFFGALDDAGVSVVYRPMHEANGNWFWFGAIQQDIGVVSSKNMIKMWQYVHDYYTDEFGLDNLLWSYCPNNSNNSYVNSLIYKDNPLYMGYYYPGDEYCDIVGMDWYTDGNYEIDGSAKSWNAILDYGKPTGICEFGIGSALRAENQKDQSEIFSCEGYIEIFERMLNESKKISFAVAYAGEYGAPSYLGKGSAIANSSIIVSLEEMCSIIAEILK